MSKQNAEYSYYILKNSEEQFSIWPAFKEVPPGWEKIGEPNEKDVCLDYISEKWTDIQPKSTRVDN